MLARRWKAHMGIGEGETRSIAAWARVLARSMLSCRREVLDISDNFGAVALVCRGRACLPHLNRVCRVIAACEAAASCRLQTTWSDTARMPADHGTREDRAGRLCVGRVLAPRRALFIDIYGSGNLSICVSQHLQIEVSSWDILKGPEYDLSQWPSVKHFRDFKRVLTSWPPGGVPLASL